MAASIESGSRCVRVSVVVQNFFPPGNTINEGKEMKGNRVRNRVVLREKWRKTEGEKMALCEERKKKRVYRCWGERRRINRIGGSSLWRSEPQRESYNHFSVFGIRWKGHD